MSNGIQLRPPVNMSLEEARSGLRRMREQIEKAESLTQVQNLQDQLTAIQAIAERRGKEGHALAVEVADALTFAETRMGEIRSRMEKAKGRAGHLAGRDSSGGTRRVPPEKARSVEPATLADLGMTKKQSARAAQLAALPAAEREAAIETLKTAGKLPTPNAVLRTARAVPEGRNEEIASLIDSGIGRKAVSAKLGISVSAVAHSLKRLGRVSKKPAVRLDYMNWLISEFEGSVSILEDCLVAGSVPATQIDNATPSELLQLDKVLCEMSRVAKRLRTTARLNKDAAGDEHG